MKRVFEKVLKNYQTLKKIQKIPLNKCKPIIISDIDGVLLRGPTPIKGVSQAVKKLYKLKVPLACLTNGGGQTQANKVKKMNQSFKQQLFTEDLMFLNHTPLKPKIIENSKLCKEHQLLLVTGSKDIESVLKQLKIQNYITADQLFMIANPQIYQLKDNQFDNNNNSFTFHQYTINRKQALQKVSNRIKIEQKNLSNKYEDWAGKIHSIFALNDVSPYQTALQTIHNILSIQKINKRNMPHYFASQNDIVWAGSYDRPRMAFGPFNRILQSHCKTHNLPYDHTYYGKPTIKAFSFVQKQMRERHKQGVIFFMVGDNPHADIRGANNIGWQSFLTQTGIHHSSENDPQDPATFVVKDFPQAVELIEQLVNMMKQYPQNTV